MIDVVLISYFWGEILSCYLSNGDGVVIYVMLLSKILYIYCLIPNVICWMIDCSCTRRHLHALLER
jgi:hypothetical protein